MLTQDKFNAQVLTSLNSLQKVVQSLHEHISKTQFLSYRDEWDANANAIEEVFATIQKTKKELLKKRIPKSIKDIVKDI